MRCVENLSRPGVPSLPAATVLRKMGSLGFSVIRPFGSSTVLTMISSGRVCCRVRFRAERLMGQNLEKNRHRKGSPYRSRFTMHWCSMGLSSWSNLLHSHTSRQGILNCISLTLKALLKQRCAWDCPASMANETTTARRLVSNS